MTALGKRYIAVWKHGEPTNDPRPHEPWVAPDLVKEPTKYANPHCLCDDPHEPAFLIVDLDALPRTDFTDEQRAMHAENRALYWAAEFDRLAPCLGGHPARESETVRMRAVIEAMRPIVDAALEWMGLDYNGDDDAGLIAAIGANRERLALAMSAWENSQTVSDAEKRDAVVAAAEKWREAKCDDEWCSLGDHGDTCSRTVTALALTRAIDKLREQAAEVRR